MKTKRIDIIGLPVNDEMDAIALKAAFVAYQFDQNCLDDYPGTKALVVKLSNDRAFIDKLDSVTPHDNSVERQCINAAKARLSKPVPSMVDDTGNYDWPRYYSDNDSDMLN